MFKLLVSKTLLSLSIAFLLSGPGIAVFTIGCRGSSGKKECSPLSATAAAAEACRLCSAIGVPEAKRRFVRRIGARIRPALRAKDAIVLVASIIVVGERWRGARMRGDATRSNVSSVTTNMKTTVLEEHSKKMRSGRSLYEQER